MGESFVVQVSVIGLLMGSFLINLQWQKHQLKKVQIRIKKRDEK